MSSLANISLPEFFYKWENQTPDNVYLKQPINGQYKEFTWRDAGSQVRKMVAYLRSLNLPPKSNIAIISKNCAEWMIADLSIMVSGHISVPLYPTLAADQLGYVLNHAQCQVAFIGKLDGWKNMKPGVPADVKCISFPFYNPDKSHVQWNDILENFEPITDSPVPKLDDIFTIIYTSGTTGNPKGVVFDYRAFSACLESTKEYSQSDINNARFFSYLPLSHIAERNIVESVSLVTGGTIYFPENLDTFGENLRDAHPTHFLAVPRIWTKFQAGILTKMSQKKLNLFMKIPLLNLYVKNKIKKGLGLQDTVLCLTGAAPMPSTLIKWFRKLGIDIQEAYGMTENNGAVCAMPADAIIDGFVGKVYRNMEVKITKDTGEILTRSAWQMKEYYNDPKLTAEAFDAEGWLHTGDVGELNAQNYLKITGRVKEMYKTSKGEYIAPSKIEMGFADNENIDQVCLVGSSLPQPMALVVVSNIGKKLSKDELVENLSENLKQLNPTLQSYEKIKKIIVVKDDWTVDNNMLTPTLKIKRNVIEKRYGGEFESWYAGPEKIIFEG